MAIDIPTFVYKVNYNVKTFISLLMTSDKSYATSVQRLAFKQKRREY